MKDLSFEYPEPEIVGFGRVLSTAYCNGAFWIATQMEKDRKNTIILKRKNGQSTHTVILSSSGHCHRPYLIPGLHGGVVVVWNEVDNGIWHIKTAEVFDDSDAFENIEIIVSADRLCLPPCTAYHNNELWVAWAGVEQDTLRIHTARKHGNTWGSVQAISEEDVDAFRPSLCANEKALFLVWDEYNGSSYEIAYADSNGSTWNNIKVMSHENERWFHPKAVMAGDGTAYITWVVMKEVTDRLGIRDHFPFAMVGGYKDGLFEFLPDDANTSDTRLIADFREGLLAAETYKGYLGLRRNPMLLLSENDQVWCLWEVRIESEETAVCGHLAGRILGNGKTWSQPYLLSNSGYGYSVPDSCEIRSIPTAFFKITEKGIDIIGSETVDPSKKEPYLIDTTKWDRWQNAAIEPLTRKREKVAVKSKEYSLFWLDTHCHSNVSADAEGEVDEIIHYARDIAGVDAVCVIDNDYYPNKPLTEAEWQIHQELSRHFTEESTFVVFPGYEFTFYRQDLSPDCNHRCVIYPRPGGKLFRRIDSQSNTDKKLLERLKATSAMCYPHHCSYKIIDPEKEWNVEVCSSWRVCLEETDFTIRHLQKGQKLGFLGSSDAHRANPGLGGALTGVFAEKLTPEALFDAYKHRRTIATQGFAIFIDFRAAGTFVGGETKCNGAPDIDVSVRAPQDIEFVEVIRDGKAIYRETPGFSECEFTIRDDSVDTGEHFYFLRVKLIGDPSFNTDPAENSREPFATESRYPHNLARARGVFAWTSPVWLHIQQ
jgi:hypothetical protein